MLAFQVPNPQRLWLKDARSLTYCLKKRFSSKHVALLCLQHQWDMPTKEESEVLGISIRRLCLIREVLFYYMHEEKMIPLTFGRSIIPKTTMVGKNRPLLNWGENSLGVFLFRDPTLTRTQLQPMKLTPQEPLYHRALLHSSEHPPFLWGRRSIFQVRRKPLLVLEFFLPGFFTPPAH
ncbi:MAG: chorismate lyase [Gammaproteobacteria bacterium]|nr:chorismate lyase [Gammaproteobacteria bacterium]